jgi:SPP1 gp7 family putative phage head morphogenesis protein
VAAAKSRPAHKRPFPAGGDAVLEELGARRMRREAYRFHEVRRDAVAGLERDIERAIKKATRGRWDIEAHKAALPDIRRAVRVFEKKLNAHALRTSEIAAARGVQDYRRAFSQLGQLATGKAVKMPKVDAAAIAKAVRPHLIARTSHVASHSARTVSRVASARSLLEAQKTGKDRKPSKQLAAEMAKEISRRATNLTERVIVTEMTAAAGAAVSETIAQLQPFLPLRKQWNAYLDRKTCRWCSGLHGTVVDAQDYFPGGIFEPPLHPFCRCSVTPFVDSWVKAAAVVGVMPSGEDLARATGSL